MRSGRAPRGASHPIVVGIAASGDDIEALQAFFGATPPKTGLAFVVIARVDPAHERHLPELLARSTAMRVAEPYDREPLRADHVYIAPPNRFVTVEQGRLHVKEVSNRRIRRGVIDHFFRSLAEDQGDRAVAVLLSGPGNEGTLGSRAIKAEGGLVIAQAPDTASQPGMPASVIASGLVDLVLAPEEMPQALCTYAGGGTARGGTVRAVAVTTSETLPGDDLEAILALLRARSKNDFREYRKGTLQRRIARRMRLMQIECASEYLELLRTQPDEIDRLFKDLLIGVTRFFRDPSAFDELGTRVLASLLRESDAETPIRIWVPGCATGEEAYSIAIVAAEQAAAAASTRQIRVFATDLDEDALGIARAGEYPESIALDVSSERLTRFFTRDDRRYVVAKPIRESVVFAAQNVIDDPPFPRLDLVSCRNVLIYLEPAVHRKLMTVFHFALNPGGYLFLGTAETTDGAGAWFAPVSEPSRIFQRLGTATRPLLADSPLKGTPDSNGGGAPNGNGVPNGLDSTIATVGTDALLEHLAPAAVVVSPDGKVVHVYGAMERYITLPTGQATLDIVALVRQPLKTTVRAALHAATLRGRPPAIEIAVKRGKLPVTVRITVRTLDPFDGTAERLRLIIFEERASVPERAGARSKGHAAALDAQLKMDLAAAKREHQRLVEQFERSNQALAAANQEVLSTNEELQSTNEELITSKAELLSMNEELTTVNAQLRDKVQEVIAANDDLANLFLTTDVATVFVDEVFRIKRFTPAAGQLLNMLAADVGRSLGHLATNLVDVDLVRDTRAVLATQEPIEKAVDARDGTHYILRVRPYRSGHDTALPETHGVVLTLTNVTSLKKVEEELVAAKTRLSVDLRHMSRLHALSTRLSGLGALASLLDDAVRAAIEITGADMGYIHVLDETGALELAAQAGCQQPLLDFVNRVPPGSTSIEAVALSARERVIVEDVTQSAILRDSASVNILFAAGVRAAQSTPLVGLSGELVGMLSTHTRTAHPITDANLRWLDLLARQAADVIERRRLEDMRDRTKENLNQRVKERTKWLTLLHDISQAIDQAPNWNEALRMVMGRICESEGWQVGSIYLPAAGAPGQLAAAVTYSSDKRFAPFILASQQVRHTLGQLLPGRVFADGNHVWVNGETELLKLMPARASEARQAGLRSAVALPVRVGNATLAVVELLSDRPHPDSDELVSLMSDVSTQIGRVIERENIMAQVAEIIWGEQQDLIQTLHDSLGQQLTGLGMLAASLNRRLTGTDKDNARTAREIAAAAQEALERMRQLARGLFQADLDDTGFLEALRDLASTTMAMHKIQVVVECDTPLVVPSGRAATQLYRIAQEAITNAVRHSEASRITIRLHADADLTTLTVSDDGVGLHHRAPNENGIGLRIMRHRATSIGAIFSVSAGVDAGTVVKVVL